MPAPLSVLRPLLAFCALAVATQIHARADQISIVDVRAYDSLQAAIDANPGRILALPPGEYTITKALHVDHDGTELRGPARIIQTNPKEPLLRITRASHIRLDALDFSRPGDQPDAATAGLEITDCQDVELTRLRVSDNHSHSSILVRNGRDVTVQDCTVTNYKGLAIDDRTANALFGFAFKAIDGTGIQFIGVQGAIIRNNRVEEFRLWPTEANKQKYDLGTVTVMPATRGRMMDPDIFASKYTNNWHQGAAIQVTAPEISRRVIITGNSIFHPAQGLDLHCDNVIVSNNLISYAMIGMKAVHGSKNVLIDGNEFNYCDLWGVLLMPGSNSHPPQEAADGKPARGENTDGGTVVSHNIFSNFGFGDQYWNWIKHTSNPTERVAIALLAGPLPENPSIHNLLVIGNVVYDSGADTVLVDGKWTKMPPRYRWALYVEQHKQAFPVNVHAYGNLFDAGSDGRANIPEDGSVPPAAMAAATAASRPIP